jgi:cytokinin dehydrogenase
VTQEAEIERPLLRTDDAARSGVARDMGGIVHRLPMAVARPRSVEEVVSTIRWCREQGLHVVPRGQAHTAYGQSQVAGGVVLDMRGLDRIHSMDAGQVTVEAGATWRKLLAATTARRLTPPVLTAFQGLSVGGTLSVGGVSGAAYKRGAQVDHVIALEVVTGEGRLVACSPEMERDLFEAVLAGLGQCGIIVRATVRLVPAPERVSQVVLEYPGPTMFMRDLRELAMREELDGVSGTIYPAAPGAPRYELNAFAFSPRSETQSMDHFLRGTTPSGARETQHDYLDFYFEVDRLVDNLQKSGDWDELAHPWFDVFLPETALEPWLADVVPSLGADDVGPDALGALGQVHVFPLRRSRMGRPLLRVPDGEWTYLFDILSAAHRPEAESYIARMLERNRELYQRARELGGFLYPIAAVPLGPSDWKQHFGDLFATFERCKAQYDPGRLLTPTPSIFV